MFEPDMLWVIISTFHVALRTDEPIKLEKRDFLFGHDDGKNMLSLPYVNLKLGKTSMT